MSSRTGASAGNVGIRFGVRSPPPGIHWAAVGNGVAGVLETPSRVRSMAAIGDLTPEQVRQGNGWRDRNQPFRPALEVNLFGNRDRVVHLDAEVPHGALQLGVAEEELHGAQVAGFPIDQGGLRPSEGVGPVGCRVQAD